MGAIRDFIDEGVRDNSSYFRHVAYKFWKDTGAKAKTGDQNTWIRATLYKCTGKMNLGEAAAEWNKEDSFMTMLNDLATSMLERENALEKGVAWTRVLSATTDEEQLDALNEFMRTGLEFYRNQCMDNWRNTEGTFSYYYRRAQAKLRECIGEVGWSLYDPKSRYYGPGNLETPTAVDIQDERIINSISVPPEIASDAKKIFYKKHLTTHAKHFHEKIDNTGSAAVSIRNLVRWLCNSYALLQSHGELDGDKLMASDDTAKKAQLKDLEKLAKKAASLMSDKEKKILLMRLQGLTGEEIAEKLNLSGPSHVSYYMNKIRRLMRDIKSEDIPLSGAVDEESEFNQENPSKLEQIFTECFVNFCEK